MQSTFYNVTTHLKNRLKPSYWVQRFRKRVLLQKSVRVVLALVGGVTNLREGQSFRKRVIKAVIMVFALMASVTKEGMANTVARRMRTAKMLVIRVLEPASLAAVMLIVPKWSSI
mmetsp:Transcript_148414/g.276458  ORF Transcript_148414/g.276458 Transcript_148414/m.276458 type:complete len:115 (+) Transcript_148414:114-458(+)